MIATAIERQSAPAALPRCLLAPSGYGRMWRAVRDQIDAFPAEVLADSRPRHCPITGVPLTVAGARAVYRPPHTFTGLLRAFLVEYGAAPGACPDQHMIDHWTAYHAQRADLWLVSTPFTTLYKESLQ